MKYGFYVSGGAGRLIHTLNQLEVANAATDFIDFVVTDNTNPLLQEKSEKHKFPLYVVSYESLQLAGRKQSEYLSEYLLEQLTKHQTMYCFVFGNKILRGELLIQYHNRLINFHPSVLPAYKGLSAIDQALNESSFLLGNTAHFIDQGVDTGPIIMQNIIHRSQYTDYNSVLNNQYAMIIQIIAWINQGRLSVSDRIVSIKDADYSIGTYIPQLELDI